MTLELRIMSGSRAGMREWFDKSVVSVGRHPLSDLRFDPQQDLDVSTRHAELRGIDGVWTIHDQQSTNGTFVNGTRLQGERVLREGDTISFGANGPRVEIRLGARHAEGAEAAAAVGPVSPVAPRAATPPAAAARKDTTLRIAEAVAAGTRPHERALWTGAGAVAALAVLGALVWQRQASARDRELLALVARSESTSAALERAVAEMAPRDSAFAALLAERAESSRRARRSLGAAGGAPTADQIALYSTRVAADAREHESLLRLDFAAVHDRNDRAVAMVASDLDGTFIAGTAFGVTSDGLLVTNRHVLRAPSGQPARRVRVIFANTGTWLDARIVRMDEESDLALLQVTTPGRYPTVAGVSRTGALARPGAPVASIGFPHATDTPMEGTGLNVTARTTIAAGTVSKRLADVTQVDSYAGKGSSGSPLFDAKAHVVGVVFGGAPESNGRIVYAVPAERLAAFIGRDAPGVMRN
jgi:S1-C subfamily serine protease